MIEYLFTSIFFYFKLFYLCILIFIFGIDKNTNNIINFIEFSGPVFIKIFQNFVYKNNINKKLKNKFLKLCSDNKYTKFKLSNIPGDFKFDDVNNPYAVGSIAVIWTGYYNNKKSIIKIVKPNIKNEIKRSIYLFEIFIFIFNLFFSKYNILSNFNKKYIYKQLLNSTNLLNEKNNIQKFNFLFKNYNDLVIIPKIYYSDKNILIESFHTGYNIEIIKNLYKDKLENTINLIQSVFYKMFFDNFLHADIHPGNFLINFNQNGNPYLILLDFGLVEKFDKDFFFKLVLLFQKNIFFPNLYKFIMLLSQINLNKNANLDNFILNSNQYLDEINYNNQIKIMMYNLNSIKYKLIPFNKLILKILEIAYINKLLFPGNILILINTFLLIDEYRSLYYGNSISWKKRIQFIKDNNFYNDIKHNILKIL